MTTPESKLQHAVAAMQEHRHEEALGQVSAVFGAIVSGDAAAALCYPLTMVLWSQLAATFGPARGTLMVVRNYHADLLLSGDTVFFGRGTPNQQSRFELLVHIDQILGNSQGTYALFKHLLGVLPEAASRDAHLALPAIIGAGDYVLADRILGDPLARLEELNGLSVLHPLVPAPNTAPRLAAELANFMRDVHMRVAVLHGLGRGREADALINRVKTGIVARDMRELAERELAAPGTIVKEMAARQHKADAQRAQA